MSFHSHAQQRPGLGTHFGMPDLAQQHHVSDVVPDHALLLAPYTTVREALMLARRLRNHYLTVVSDQGEPLGVVCRCNLESAPDELEVGACMRSPAHAIGLEATLEQAGEELLACGVGCLPVVSQHMAVGLLTRRDLVRLKVLDASVAPSCTLCGALEHVSPAPEPAAWLCRGCRDRGPPSERLEVDDADFGGGD
jgi:signal-transduction protein with cAMP-binding, CBS, and nucleotidyltransferase domain